MRDWISKRLTELGKKKVGLAAAMNIAQPRVQEIISGKREIKTSEIPAFARYLEISASEAVALYSGNQEVVTPPRAISKGDGVNIPDLNIFGGMNQDNEIGKRIKHVRTQVLGLSSQEAFAKQLGGVTRGTVANWEVGKGVKTENLRRISEAFGISINWLVNGEGDMPETAEKIVTGNWLTPFLKKSGLSQERLAERIGKSRVQINRYANEVSGIKPDVARVLAPHLGVTPEALLAASLGSASTGTHQPTRSKSIPDLKIFGGMGGGGALSITVGADGLPNDPDEVRGFWTLPEYVTARLGSLKGIYAFAVEGDSMEPTIADGSVVLVNTNRNSPPPDDVYALDYGDGLVVKRLQLIPQTQNISIISDNPHYGAHTLERSQVHVYGRIIACFSFGV